MFSSLNQHFSIKVVQSTPRVTMQAKLLTIIRFLHKVNTKTFKALTCLVDIIHGYSYMTWMNKNKQSDMAATRFIIITMFNDLKDGNNHFNSISIFKAHTKTTRVWIPIMVTFEFRVTFCAPVAAVLPRVNKLAGEHSSYLGKWKTYPQRCRVPRRTGWVRG